MLISKLHLYLSDKSPPPKMKKKMFQGQTFGQFPFFVFNFHLF
jgi:hypothetical protein